MPGNAKVCTLLMNEMSLKSNLFYDESGDTITSFQDFGEGKQSNLLANSALVFMAWGIVESWKQPVPYYFVNEACNSDFLKDLVEENIFQLELMESRMQWVFLFISHTWWRCMEKIFCHF